MVSSDWLLDLIEAIRSAIPEDVIEAERLLQSRHRLVEDARDEAEHMLESARDLTPCAIDLEKEFAVRSQSNAAL